MADPSRIQRPRISLPVCRLQPTRFARSSPPVSSDSTGAHLAGRPSIAVTQIAGELSTCKRRKCDCPGPSTKSISICPPKGPPNGIWRRRRRKSRPVAPSCVFFHPVYSIQTLSTGASGGAGWARGPLSAARLTLRRLHSSVTSPLASNNCTGGSFAQRHSEPSLRNTGWRKCTPRVHARRSPGL
jgi:hypothetical protein